MSRADLIVGLDIGTTKVCAVVGEMTEQGLEILGFGSYPSRGLRKGVVINVESTVASIEHAVEEAEIQSNCEINSVYVGITGGHIKSMMSHGVAALRNGSVNAKDLERVMEAAGAVVIPDDRDILHVLPCGFVVDGKRQGKPLGLPGVRLEVNCHVVTAAATSAINIENCCKRAGLHVEGLVFEPYASAMSVLTPMEKEHGVALLDIGGGTSDLVVIRNNAVIYSTVFALGGNHLTNDVAEVLKIPAAPTAEKLKKQYGSALHELTPDEPIEASIPGSVEPRFVSRKVLAEILGQRMEEILRLVHATLENSGYAHEAKSGIVLTGGCSLLEGTDKLAEKVFGIPARIGSPKNHSGKFEQIDSPMYATGLGLIHYGAQQSCNGNGSVMGKFAFNDVFSRMKQWFASFF